MTRLLTCVGDGEGVAKAGGQVTGKGDAKVAVARGRKRKADTDSEVGGRYLSLVIDR